MNWEKIIKKYKGIYMEKCQAFSIALPGDFQFTAEGGELRFAMQDFRDSSCYLQQKTGSSKPPRRQRPKRKESHLAISEGCEPLVPRERLPSNQLTWTCSNNLQVQQLHLTTCHDEEYSLEIFHSDCIPLTTCQIPIESRIRSSNPSWLSVAFFFWYIPENEHVASFWGFILETIIFLGPAVGL